MKRLHQPNSVVECIGIIGIMGEYFDDRRHGCTEFSGALQKLGTVHPPRVDRLDGCGD